MRRRSQAGFTLAELLVASVLLSIVLGGVYVAFSTGIRLWRHGESTLSAYQDARTSMAILTRELHCVVRGTEHLFEGKDDSFAFYALVPPMDVEDGAETQVMWVQYRLKNNPEGVGETLVREEALVEGPIPLAEPGEDDVDLSRIKLGRKRKFEVASNVLSFDVSYYRVPFAEGIQDVPAPAPVPRSFGSSGERRDGAALDTGFGVPGGAEGGAADYAAERPQAPEPVEFVIEDKNPRGSGLPQGIRIIMTMVGGDAAAEEPEFTTFVTFRGCPVSMTEAPLHERDEGRL